MRAHARENPFSRVKFITHNRHLIVHNIARSHGTQLRTESHPFRVIMLTVRNQKDQECGDRCNRQPRSQQENNSKNSGLFMLDTRQPEIKIYLELTKYNTIIII